VFRHICFFPGEGPISSALLPGVNILLIILFICPQAADKRCILVLPYIFPGGKHVQELPDIAQASHFKVHRL
jgi:hypothetical protein